MKRIVAVASLLALGFVGGKIAPPLVVRAEDAIQDIPAAPRAVVPVRPSAQPGPPTYVVEDRAIPAPRYADPTAGPRRFDPYFGVVGANAAAADPNAKLRKQWLDLMARRAAEMTDDELQKQILEMSQRIVAKEKEADDQMAEIVQQLTELNAKYRGTRAATRAQHALIAIQNATHHDRPAEGVYAEPTPAPGPALRPRARPILDGGDLDR